jgi:thioesterase domain-containing protein
MPTPLLETCFGEAWPPGLALRAVFVGGDALRRRPPAGFPCKLYNMYGPTENTVVSTCAEVVPAARDSSAPTIGFPIDGVLAYVLDEHGVPVPPGVAGELYLGGAGLAHGYRRHPELTAERFIANPFGDPLAERLYRSGDLARYRANGELEFLGRSDDQVKIRGYRVEPGEIEIALLARPGVREAKVLVHGELAEQRRIAAYVVVVPEDQGTMDAAVLLGGLSKALPDFMIPSSIELLAELPLNANGKLDRAALPQPKMREHTELPSRAPQDELEREVANLWGELLEYSPVGMDDHFFRSGGHSLLALHLKAELEARFNVSLPLAVMLEHPTPATIAQQIKSAPPLRPQALRANEPGRAGMSRSPSDSLFGRSLRRLRTMVGGQKHSRAEVAQVLVPLAPGGTLAPLFCAHPAGGTVACYAELAALLGSERPVFGLQAPFLDGASRSYALEDLAALYVAAMKSCQGTGPYRLAGWSMGGVIAYEMAQQLRSMNEEVALLALIDSYPFQVRTGTATEHELLMMFAADLLQHYPEAVPVPARLSPDLGTPAALHAVAECLVAAAGSGPWSDATQFEQLWLAFQRGYDSWACYEPQPYGARMELILAGDSVQDERYNVMSVWAPLAGAGFGVDVLPGNHYSLLREPGLALTAQRLKALLRNADGLGAAAPRL